MDEDFTSNKQKFRANLSFICDNTTNVKTLAIALVTKKIISEHDLERIMSEKTTYDRNYALYKEIMKKLTSCNFSVVLEALRNTYNEHIADVIEGKSSININKLGTLKRKLSSEELETTPCSKRHRLLGNKWWPEEKIVVNSFVERYNNDGELIINKLKENLDVGDDKKIVITQKTVVCGLGGIGKSTTAKWFAGKYSGEYNHIIWIDCEGSILSNSIRRLANQLKIEQNLGENLPPRPIEDVFADIENALSDYKILFIYDNAEEYTGQVGIKNILPKLKSTQCIITSRNQIWGSSDGYGKIPVYQLDVFTLEEALNFLKRSLAGKITTEEMLEKLAKDLGYLPLALQHAVAAIKSIPKMTVKKYIDKIQEQKELYRFIQLDKLDDYEKSIFATLSVTLNQLREMEPDGQEAVDILYVCAFFRPDYIPTSIFEADGAFCLLDQYSMVGNYKSTNENEEDTEEDEDDDDEIYVTMHRLLQQVIFLQVKKDGQIVETLDKAIEALSKCKNAEYHGDAVWDYIEKHMELIQRYSDFPNIVYKLQDSYLDNDLQEKFISSLTSVENIPNGKNVIDFITTYVDNYSSDEGRLDYLFKLLGIVIELLSRNTRIDDISKDNYLLAARYNQIKVLVRLNRACETMEILQILCTHAVQNKSGRIWTSKTAKDFDYIFSALDMSSNPVIVREWEELLGTYETPPDILKLGCLVYKNLRDLQDKRSVPMDQECSSVVGNLLSLLSADIYKSSWLEKTFQGIFCYHKGDCATSYDSFIEGLRILQNSTLCYPLNIYVNMYGVILKEYPDLVERGDKWDSFCATVSEFSILSTDITYSITGSYKGTMFLLNRLGLRIEGICRKYQKQQHCAIILEKLVLFMNKFQCMDDEEKSSAAYFNWMADIAERSAECYTENGDYDSAVSVWKNVCLRLKSIPSNFKAFMEMTDPQTQNYACRTKSETLGDSLKNVMKSKKRVAELEIIESESDDVRQYFSYGK